MTKDAPASHIMSQNRLPAFSAIAAESVYKKLGKEKCSKSGEILGNAAVLVRISDP
jgi:hypothetical protein